MLQPAAPKARSCSIRFYIPFRQKDPKLIQPSDGTELKFNLLRQVRK
jgi:hypothetical protein